MVSSPAFAGTASAAPDRLYLQDGDLLKAYRLSDNTLLWAQRVGFYWASMPRVGADGTVYTLTYDLLPSKEQANFVLTSFSPDGGRRAQYQFLHKPTPLTVLPNNLVIVGLAPLAGPQPELKGTGQEPAGATTVGLTPDLQGAWNNNLATEVRLQPVTDGFRVYVMDRQHLSVVDLNGNSLGQANVPDPQNIAQLAAAQDGSCYIAVGTSLYRFVGTTQVWQTTLPTAVLPETLVADATGCYFASADHLLHAYSAADGLPRWQFGLPSAAKVRTALDAGGQLFVLASYDNLTGMDTLNVFSSAGEPLRSEQLGSQALGRPVIADGIIAWAAAAPRVGVPTKVMLYRTAGGSLATFSAAEVPPQAVINGQSTLNPPWPALR
jgi:outer membrane protein assembly factor BamB